MFAPRPIPDSYWVVPGMLAAGEYPGTVDARQTRTKLARFLDAGLRSFIDLTEDGELRPYARELEDLGTERGLEVRHFRMAIEDLSVPAAPHLQEILALIDRCISDGSPAYVHCWGGIGRTGTVIGCWLTRNGFSGEGALEHIARLREETPDGYRRSPETSEQWAMVLAFAAGETQHT